ncbi:MAG: CinA family protein [Nocardioidaceae bacterium]
MTAEPLHQRAADLLAALAAEGATLSVAESVTGGLLAAELTAVAGASGVFRGGVIAYATGVKRSTLGVPDQLVRSAGVVSSEMAEAMAAAVRERLDSTYALSSTGVAGPDRQEGKPPGTVHVAVAGPGANEVLALALTGDRHTIRRAACEAAIDLLHRRLAAAGTSEDW